VKNSDIGREGGPDGIFALRPPFFVSSDQMFRMFPDGPGTGKAEPSGRANDTGGFLNVEAFADMLASHSFGKMGI